MEPGNSAQRLQRTLHVKWTQDTKRRRDRHQPSTGPSSPWADGTGVSAQGNWPRFPLQGEARSAGPGGGGAGGRPAPRVLTSSRLVSRSREEGEGPTQRAGVRWQGRGRAGPASAAALSFCPSLRPGALPTADSRKSREGAGKAPQTVLHPPPLWGPGGPDAARPTVPPPAPPASSLALSGDYMQGHNSGASVLLQHLQEVPATWASVSAGTTWLRALACWSWELGIQTASSPGLGGPGRGGGALGVSGLVQSALRQRGAGLGRGSGGGPAWAASAPHLLPTLGPQTEATLPIGLDTRRPAPSPCLLSPPSEGPPCRRQGPASHVATPMSPSMASLRAVCPAPT